MRDSIARRVAQLERFTVTTPPAMSRAAQLARYLSLPAAQRDPTKDAAIERLLNIARARQAEYSKGGTP